METLLNLNFILQPFNVLMVIWFFILYFLLFILLKNANGFNKTFSNLLDFTAIFLVFILCFFLFFFIHDDQKMSFFNKTINLFLSFLNDSISIIPVTFLLILFYLFINYFNVPAVFIEKSLFITTIESILWILFTVLIVVNFFKFVLYIETNHFQ
jgi:hypothetical protein